MLQLNKPDADFTFRESIAFIVILLATVFLTVFNANVPDYVISDTRLLSNTLK